LKHEWLRDFKIALIESDLKRLGSLQREMPTFESKDELMEAQALIAQAIELFRTENDKTKATMEQMKKAIKFQQSNLSGHAKFDKSY
jgi:hypothetical protein